MNHFEIGVARAMVLAVFLPLILSSSGSTGSQVSALVLRAIALGERHPRDWWRTVLRENVVVGSVGVLLAAIGGLTLLVWPVLSAGRGVHTPLLCLAVGLGVLGVAAWGALCGSLIPFALRRFELDPARATAPLVATIVDVSGLLIYFGIACLVLSEALLPA